MNLRRYRVLMLSGAALVSAGAGLAVAGPNGGTVAGGTATIQGAGTGSVTINQSSQKAIINWTTFNINKGETTTFNQPNSSSIALNRVTGGLGPSFLDGTLTANGRVFIVNGDGILFGPHSTINTAGFLATTNDIHNEDFMAGKYNFNIPGLPNASIVNLGTITATSGGFAALVAPGVRNSGTITATLGTVSLAAGNAFTLDFYGDRLITLAVGDQIAAKVIDVATGQPLTSLVGNDGKISASGGRVELTAAAARAVVDSVINNTGVIEADSIGTKNGMIVLGAATGASKPAGAPVQTVKLAGKISAAGKNKGTTGGTVVVTGESIALKGASIDASGQAGGGKVLIGGDTGGGKVNPAAASIELAKLESFVIPTATTVSVDAASVINASSIDKGNGGKVVLWSDQQTTFAGTILAQGGASGGNGGFVETSSHGLLNFTGTVDLRAPLGATGTLLLDPYDVTICVESCGKNGSISGGVFNPTGSPSYLEADILEGALAKANVLLTTGGAVTGTDAGNINVNTSVLWTSNNTLTLSAYNNINIAAGVTISNAPLDGQPNPAGNLVLRADNSGRGIGTVTFSETGAVDFSQSAGKVSIYYNPSCGTQTVCINKYQHSQDTFFGQHVTTSSVGRLTAYMLVNNAGDLQLMGQNLGNNPNITGNFALGRNIILNNDGNSFNGFASGTTFNGLFTGNGGLGINYTISNLNLSAPSHDGDSYGLFPFIGANGTVRDLVLENATITAGGNIQSIGVLAGQNLGTIINVSVTSTGDFTSAVDGLKFTGISAGGLVGFNIGSITGSSAAVKVTVGDGTFCNGINCTGGGLNFAGGLVGNNSTGGTGGTGNTISSSVVSNVSVGTISSSSASGEVSGGNNSIIGGLVGENTGAITLSSASVNVSLVTNISVDSTNFNSSFAGGLVGQNGNGGSFDNVGAIISSFATGNVSGTGLALAIGGLVGDNSAGSFITDSKAFGNVTSNTDGNPQSQFGNSINAGGLIGFNQGTVLGTGKGTAAASLASSCTQGAAFSCAAGKVSVGALGVAGGLIGSNDGTATNVFASGAVTGAAGLPQGTTNNNTTTAVNNGNNNNGDNRNQTLLGGLAGVNTGAITFAFATGPVGTKGVADLEVGGLVAENHGSIASSAANGPVNAGDNSMAGGLTASSGPSNNDNGTCGSCTPGDGHNNKGLVSFSIAYGDVTVGATSVAGGLSGTGDGTFDTTSAYGKVTGGANSSLGGLVGAMSASKPSTILSSNAFGDVESIGSNSVVGGLVGTNGGSIIHSNAAGKVKGTSASYLGGLVGINVGLVQDSNANVLVTGSGSGNYAGGLVGLNFGLIDPSHSFGDVTSGANSVVGGLVGANGAFGPFNNLPNGFVIPPGSFPVGTISTDSTSTGQASSSGPGSTVGPQVGQDYPTAGLPNYPSFINSCNDALCFILANGTLTNPNPPDIPPPPPPPPPPPLPTAGIIQNLVQNTTLVSLTTDDVVNTQPLNSPPAGPSPPRPGPGPGLPPEFGARFFVVPPLTETRVVLDEAVLQMPCDMSPDRQAAILKSAGVTVLSSQCLGLLHMGTYRVHLDKGRSMAAVFQEAARHQIVAGAQANYRYALVQAQEPDLAGLTQGEGDAAQYAIGKLGLIDIHRRLKGGNISVAVIDSQIDIQHPDLDGVVAGEFDAVGAADMPHSHGTGMAGAIFSHRKLMGIAPSARLYAIHAFSSGAASAESTTFNILKGLEWAASKGVRVINMSFAGPRDPSLERALKAAHDKGIVLIAAAGNAGPKSPPLYPGADPNVIAVTATDVNDKLFSGANRGRYIAVAAPGVDILVPAPDNTYQLTTGTSVASAEVAGLAALLLERNPNLTPEDVRKILTSSARRLGAKDRDDDFGSGLIDPSKAIQTAGDLKAADITGVVPPATGPQSPAPTPTRPSVLPVNHPSGSGLRPIR